MQEIPGDRELKGDFWFMDMQDHLKASPQDIWPWLVQMGNGRAGWYSYDWIDNFGRSSFSHIDQKFQKIEVGQKISIFAVSDFKENQYITLSSGKANITWLIKEDSKGCQLITRVRASGPKFLLSVTLGPGHYIMQKKQYKELKKRVETR